MPSYFAKSSLLKQGTSTLAYGPGAPVTGDTGGVEDSDCCANVGMARIGDSEWGKLIWWIGRGVDGQWRWWKRAARWRQWRPGMTASRTLASRRANPRAWHPSMWRRANSPRKPCGWRDWPAAWRCRPGPSQWCQRPTAAAPLDLRCVACLVPD
jgi:hypothetical protein